jgi:uncharacterized protein (TIGR03790 family)
VTKMVYRMLFWLILSSCSLAHAQRAPLARLEAAQLAVVVNDDDPNSVAVAEHYQKVRQIPEQNIIRIRLPNAPRRLTLAEFKLLRRNIEIQLMPHMEAILLIWSAPYAVECQSITSALSLGFDPDLCSKSCAPSKPSPYFNSASTKPFTQLGFRPSMLLPADSVELAKAVISNGVTSGFRQLPASAYYVQTNDPFRNTRTQFFPTATSVPSKNLKIQRLSAQALEGAQDIIIYQLGAKQVDKLDTLHFLPGALADHLTSFGGDLLESSQMSILRWLQSGATASYGTVSEPCNHWQKFPHPSVLLQHYLSGNTALEAYWKSVAWPAQGIFIGEPLAAPYQMGH